MGGAEAEGHIAKGQIANMSSGRAGALRYWSWDSRGVLTRARLGAEDCVVCGQERLEIDVVDESIVIEIGRACDGRFGAGHAAVVGGEDLEVGVINGVVEVEIGGTGEISKGEYEIADGACAGRRVDVDGVAFIEGEQIRAGFELAGPVDRSGIEGSAVVAGGGNRALGRHSGVFQREQCSP